MRCGAPSASCAWSSRVTHCRMRTARSTCCRRCVRPSACTAGRRSARRPSMWRPHAAPAGWSTPRRPRARQAERLPPGPALLQRVELLEQQLAVLDAPRPRSHLSAAAVDLLAALGPGRRRAHCSRVPRTMPLAATVRRRGAAPRSAARRLRRNRMAAAAALAPVRRPSSGEYLRRRRTAAPAAPACGAEQRTAARRSRSHAALRVRQLGLGAAGADEPRALRRAVHRHRCRAGRRRRRPVERRVFRTRSSS
jgi:hypothetical protein